MHIQYAIGRRLPPSIVPPYNLVCPRSSRQSSAQLISSVRSSSGSSFSYCTNPPSWAAVSKQEGRPHMAATVTVTATSTTSKVGRKSGLISRTLQRCKSGLSAGRGVVSSGRSSLSSPPGCFSVYVGPERERFVVRAECANHPLFRRLLDDAEGEYGYTAQGPLALPGCDVEAFLDVLWQMENAADADEEVAAASSPICGLHSGSKGRAAGYRMMSSPMAGRRR